MSDKLTVVEQREVDFYDDQLTAVRAGDGQIYVSIRRMCDALGVDRRGQMRRIREHGVLAEGYKRGGVISPPSDSGRGGGRQEAAMLRVDLVPLWLSGISPNRVKAEIQPKLERFQREAAKVLWEAFQEGRLTAEPSLDDLLATNSPAAQAYRIASAVMELARNQLILESRVDNVEERLEAIESQLGDPGRAITPDQASQISQAVKAVAIVLGKQTKRNEFGAVYGEMYRREGITSYKLLPTRKFERVMQWLADWYRDITDGADVPF